MNNYRKPQDTLREMCFAVCGQHIRCLWGGISPQNIVECSLGGVTMDQVKIGKFIAQCRNEKNITQIVHLL